MLSDTQLEAGTMVGTEGDSGSVIRKLPFCLGGHANKRVHWRHITRRVELLS